MSNPYGRPKIPLGRRFARYTAIRESGCHEWIGKVSKNTGYGHICIREGGAKLTRLAHRAAYEFFVGRIPDGLLVLHKCDNRICINPAHLYVGTQKDNVRDIMERGQHGIKPKLTPSQVLKVRELLTTGRSAASLAREFQVDAATIGTIKEGRRLYVRKILAGVA